MWYTALLLMDRHPPVPPGHLAKLLSHVTKLLLYCSGLNDPSACSVLLAHHAIAEPKTRYDQGSNKYSLVLCL
jgi:hypothetical protein